MTILKVSKQLLGTRERDTLLVTIAALAKKANVHIFKPSTTGSLIEGLTDPMETPMSKRAIEEQLKNFAAALSSRSR